MAVLSPEQIREMEERRIQQALSQRKIAESKAAATPVIQAGGPLAGGGAGQSGPSLLQQFGMKALGSLFGGLFNKGGYVKHMSGGGPLAKHPNPNGYAEGGAVGETPIKKVMDEQKLLQQAMAFERDEARKDEKHQMAMQQQKQAFSEAQRMKKESATTNMKPKKPLEKK